MMKGVEMTNKFILVGMLLVVFSCATTDDAARAYFKNSNVKGVEPFDALMQRMKKDQNLRDIMYGQTKAYHLTQCVVLRNQLYVAALKGSANKAVIEATKLMENAYQENDDAFLAACNQVMSTEAGKTFMVIQQEYMTK